MAERAGEAVPAPVRAEVGRRLAAAGEHEGAAAELLSPIRADGKEGAVAAGGEDAHARADLDPAFQRKAEQVGDGRRLTGCGIDAADRVGEKDAAQRRQGADEILRAEAGEDGGDAPGVPRKVMFGGHRRVGHVALPVAGRRQFAAQAVVAFEEQDVLHPALRQAQRAEHTGRAAADDDRRVFLHNALPCVLHEHCTARRPLLSIVRAGWSRRTENPSPGGTHPAERGARCRAGRTRRTESPSPGGTDPSNGEPSAGRDGLRTPPAKGCTAAARGETEARDRTRAREPRAMMRRSLDFRRVLYYYIDELNRAHKAREAEDIRWIA